MSWELGFSAVNLLVMPAWALLILLPRAKVTRAIVHSMLYPIVIGAIYMLFVIAYGLRMMSY